VIGGTSEGDGDGDGDGKQHPPSVAERRAPNTVTLHSSITHRSLITRLVRPIRLDTVSARCLYKYSYSTATAHYSIASNDLPVRDRTADKGT
jgi:hypothetical protein